MEEIQFHEDLKQCAIFSYGKTQELPVNNKGYTKSDGTEVSGYKRECYIHGPNAVKSYFGKAIKEMTNEEINELLDDYI